VLITDKTWSSIGKILTIAVAIITLLGTSLYIYDYFSNDYEIQAYGDYFEFEMPDNIYESINKFSSCNENSANMEDLKLFFRDTIHIKEDKNIQGIMELEDEKYKAIYTNLYKYFCNEVTETFPEKKFSDLMNLRTIYQFEIINEGSKEVRELILQLPHKGLYKVQDDDPEHSYTKYYTYYLANYGNPNGFIPKTKDFDKNIELGTLRSSNKLYVTVWTSEDASPYRYGENIKITYSEGSVDIEFPVRVRGLPAWLEDYYPIFVGMLIGLVFLIIFNIILKISEAKAKNS